VRTVTVEPGSIAEALDRARGRREWTVCAGLLVAYALLHLVAVRHHALLLGNPEELVHLRLARQLAADLPIGSWDVYLYGPTQGAGGIGPLILSLLYVPVSWVLGTGHTGLRGMALLWALASALLVGAIAARLLGRGGRAAGIASCLLLPPAWLGLSSTVYANYLEASVLCLLALYLFVVAGQSLGTVRRRASIAGGLGLVAGTACVFNPASVALIGPILLVTGLLPGSAKLRLATVGPALAGAATAVLPWWPLLTVDRAGHLVLPSWRAPLEFFVGARDAWGENLALTYAALPVDQIWEHQGGLDVPPWAATTWRIATWSLLAALALRGLLGGRFPGSTAWTAEKRLVAIVVGATALAIPLALTLTGLGPDSLDGPRVYHWNWRRQALVYPLAALAWAWLLHGLFDPHGHPSRRGLAIALGLVPLAAGLFSIAVAFSGEAPPTHHRPQDFALCPQSEPALEGAICVDLYTSWNQLDVVATLVEATGDDLNRRRSVLAGFGAVHRVTRGCQFIAWKVLLAEIEGADAAVAGWHAVGASSVATCGGAETERFCAEAPSPEFVEACLRGGAEFASAAWQPGTGWTPTFGDMD